MDFHTILQFTVLGLGIGALYGVVAQGIVLVYRGSGILNLAQGAFVMVGAYTYYEVTQRHDLPRLVGIICAPVAGFIVGALTYHLVLRPMRHSSALSKIVATLAVLLVLQAAAVLRYGIDVLSAPSWLPTNRVKLFWGASAGADRLLILAIGLVTTAILTVVYRWTKFGRVTSAVAENERSAATLGYSPDRVASINWGLGSAVAALGGALLAPITFLQPTTLVMMVVPALAAALVGKFTSFPLTFAGALAVGVVESLLTRYVKTPGWSQSVPFMVVILVLLLRGSSLPLRSHVIERLPSVGGGQVRRVPTLVFVGFVISLLSSVLSTRWVDALTVTMIFTMVCLSVVVVTGYGGQLSLAQYIVAGLGAFVAAKASAETDIPFPLAILLAMVVNAVIGFLVGLPALRSRGAYLAIATLGLGIVGFALVLSNYQITGGLAGLAVPSPSLFGLDIDAIRHPRRYAIFVLGVVVGSALIVGNVRRSRSGRRLLAVRSNERAAAALGVDVYAAKLYAFVLASCLASVAGVLMGFRLNTVVSSQFTVFTSITVIGMTVVGGVGYIGGAVFGATLLPGGFGSEILRDVDVDRWLPLISGIFLLYVLRSDEKGLFWSNLQIGLKIASIVSWPYRRWKSSRQSPEAERAALVAVPEPPALDVSTIRRVPARTLDVSEITVDFGGVRAVDHVSFQVVPGEVHGLIGPNGAGKTTVIDAITGFVRTTSGSVRLDATVLDGMPPRRRTRAGLSRSFQSLELFVDLTVRENLSVASDAGQMRRYLFDLVKPGKIQLSSHASMVSDEFGLTPLLDTQPGDLSFGQRKLVAIARAVAAAPSVLFLDEPAAGLDDAESTELANVIRTLADDWGMGVLLVEHNTDLVLSVCDRVTVLAGGKVLMTGTPAEVRSDQRVRDVYLGAGRDESVAAP